MEREYAWRYEKWFKEKEEEEEAMKEGKVPSHLLCPLCRRPFEDVGGRTLLGGAFVCQECYEDHGARWVRFLSRSLGSSSPEAVSIEEMAKEDSA